MPIRILDPDLAAKIAAGEVVERPASAVKELVENAIDAGAGQIAIEIRGGGLELIRVVDDGGGIPADQVETAFQRHATSKIAATVDLSRVTTLGFRGEALPSIAAVAEVEIVTRTAEAPAASVLVVSAGVVGERSRRGAPPGTTVSVRRLFQNVPARLKFLKSPVGEAGRIGFVVGQFALAYPEIRFSLTIDGRASLLTTGSGDRREVVLKVHGLDAARAMVSVEREHEGPPAVRVHGLVSLPTLTRSSRNGLSLFVNRRWVQSRMLAHAVEEAYLELLPAGRHPVGVVDLGLPPEEVDVNVHPAKAEVKFRSERIVYAAVQRAVRETVVREMPVPEIAARPASVPGPNAQPAPGSWPGWEPGAFGPAATPAGLDAASLESTGSAYRPPADRPPRAVPVLRVLGQLRSVYVLAEGPDGLYLIDQHTAHERILYERFLAQRRARAVEVQGLLDPVAVDLTPEQDQALRDGLPRLAELGFELEPFGERTCLLRAVPALLRDRDWREGLRQVIEALGGPGAGDEWVERAAASMACHSAIRAGEILTFEEMRELIRQLEEAELPYVCPHGRPVIVLLSTAQLEREFGRR